MNEFCGLLGFDSVPNPGPRAFITASGRRKFYVQEKVQIHEIENSWAHEQVMAKLASRAVRWFAEQPVEIEWHTLQFNVVGIETDERQNELAELWRWEVWVS